MKNPITPQEIKITLCTVSASVLLFSSMEVQAASTEDESIPWYRQDVPAFTLPTPDPVLTNGFTANTQTINEAAPSAWERVYGRASRQAETDYLASQFSGSSDSLSRGPALYTLKDGSGATQRVGLLGGRASSRATATAF